MPSSSRAVSTCSVSSLNPFHSKVRKLAKTRTSRRYFWTGKGWKVQYRSLWEAAHGPAPDGFHIHHQDFNSLNDPVNYFPLVNRATQGQYAPGSTFKLVSSIAMNTFGIRPYNVYYNDVGKVFIGNDWFYNDRSTSNGSVSLSQALTVSSDTYFYTAGDAFWNAWNAGDTARGLGLEETARSLGFDKKTGIEIDEAAGRIPDPTWKQNFANAYYKTEPEKRDNGRWYPGDDVHLAVGQGDVLVTPLQLANAYAAFANGGTLPTPHLGMIIKDAKGHLVRRIAPKPQRTVLLDPVVRAQMLLGFKNVVQSGPGRPVGTAYIGRNSPDRTLSVWGCYPPQTKMGWRKRWRRPARM